MFHVERAENFCRVCLGLDRNFRRPRASAKSTFYCTFLPKTCDQIRVKSRSLFLKSVPPRRVVE